MFEGLVVADESHGFKRLLFNGSGAPVDAVLHRLRAGEPLSAVVKDFRLTSTEAERCRELLFDEAPRLAAAAAKAHATSRISVAAPGSPTSLGLAVNGAGSADAASGDDLAARLRAWTPSQCWHCGEWGCVNAAGHDIDCVGECGCDTDCDCACSVCGGDAVCTCDCHTDLSNEAAEEIARLREAVATLLPFAEADATLGASIGRDHVACPPGCDDCLWHTSSLTLLRRIAAGEFSP
jgi:uncharacterized protein (DUF433 family)